MLGEERLEGEKRGGEGCAELFGGDGLFVYYYDTPCSYYSQHAHGQRVPVAASRPTRRPLYDQVPYYPHLLAFLPA